MSYFEEKTMFIHSVPESILRDIDVVTEFVERWNKKDEELQVADSAARLETYVRDYREGAKKQEKGLAAGIL